jgi:hypothetical protein
MNVSNNIPPSYILHHILYAHDHTILSSKTCYLVQSQGKTMEDPDDSEFRTLMQKLNAVEQKVDEVVEFNNSHDDD